MKHQNRPEQELALLSSLPTNTVLLVHISCDWVCSLQLQNQHLQSIITTYVSTFVRTYYEFWRNFSWPFSRSTILSNSQAFISLRKEAHKILDLNQFPPFNRRAKKNTKSFSFQIYQCWNWIQIPRLCRRFTLEVLRAIKLFSYDQSSGIFPYPSDDHTSTSSGSFTITSDLWIVGRTILLGKT